MHTDQDLLRFGLGMSSQPSANTDPVEEAVRAEELGFDFVSASDHLHGASPTYEPWTLLTWIAASTSTIEILTRVLAVPHRNPAVLAKMAESLQRISSGRLILGLGAGHSDEEFRSLGLGTRSPAEKVEALREAIHIIRGLWSEDSVTFDGRFYNTDAARIEPKPERRIPIWLGTYGKRALDVTGRLADGWIPSVGYAPPEVIPMMLERITAAARSQGRQADDITMVYNMDVRIGQDPAQTAVTGSPEQIAEQLAGFVHLGFNVFNLTPSGPDRLEQIERLANDTIPLAKELAPMPAHRVAP